ncbi:LuxR family two component transcriptional regulator [Cereibacter ovatus]|uniref:LuxR family two component transcriptional regulator n=1 Tax=Cereibacter ovatus TaxID=439529 RepID=A0A285CXW1_9RHOB|nr:response regulator transcription factor [Cereibacter ovatus]SNX72392.1 LuxR family two component transcriptional regulator [Cereibacter ovatus]
MTQTSKIRILIADDHQLVRDLVAIHLAGLGKVECHTAESLPDVLARIEAHGAFDIVLLDLDMPGMAGLASVASVIEANAPGRVVIFSGTAPRDLVVRAMDIGASGFIPKSLPAKSLLSALRFVLSGEVYMPISFVTEPAPRTDSPSGLTAKEVDVLKAIRSGMMNREIASRMNLSEVAVKMHVRSICAKLNARNRTHAALLATTLDFA